jgi:serine/threonine-protein kinase
VDADALDQVLGEAHRQSIVHADLKPENIFLARPRDLDSVQTVKVLDFGIARIVQQSSTSYLNHGILGSPRWMAPEQLQEGGRITPATDVWALGVLAFRLFTGRHYWPQANRERAPVVAVLVRVVGEPIVAASVRAAQYRVEERVPRGFDAWFARCVNRSDRARFQDAAEAADALMEALSGDASLVTTVPEGRKPPDGTRPLDPREGELARALLAFTLAEQQGDLDRAVTFGERALALAPDHAELRRRLAAVKSARGGRSRS